VNVLVTPHIFGGKESFCVPASKSHTIRRLLLAALGSGVSRIEGPLDSLDTRSCAAAVPALGAKVAEERKNGILTAYIVQGAGAVKTDASGADIRRIDAGNSGTTLFLLLAAASLGNAPYTFSGDEQIMRRSAGPLLDALSAFGVSVSSHNGCVPITVCGPWKGGRARVECPTSQYLSALLMAAPLAPKGCVTRIDVPLLNEKPYIDMTLAYLAAHSVPLEFTPGYSRFRIAGGASYHSQNGPVPGDFSSAAFPAAAAVISGGRITLVGLDPADTQGDKVFFEYLERMGCTVEWKQTEGVWQVTVFRTGPLKGGIFDLNATPDMLPVMAVLGAYANGKTELINAAHARIKETDRIACMARELKKLGVECIEKKDGLVIGAQTARGKETPPVMRLDGYGDHRIVMALACAALGSQGPVEITTAEAVDVTYPGFWELFKKPALI
jgi:3-phosphoshikimate 1-carboxyvinyltransferase